MCLGWHASYIVIDHTDHQEKVPLHSHSNNHHRQSFYCTVIVVCVCEQNMNESGPQCFLVTIQYHESCHVCSRKLLWVK